MGTSFEQRKISHAEEKKAIAAGVVDAIPDGCTLFVKISTPLFTEEMSSAQPAGYLRPYQVDVHVTPIRP